MKINILIRQSHTERWKFTHVGKKIRTLRSAGIKDCGRSVLEWPCLVLETCLTCVSEIASFVYSYHFDVQTYKNKLMRTATKKVNIHALFAA